MKKILALAFLLAFPVSADAACTAEAGGLQLDIPNFNDPGPVWGKCMRDNFITINSTAALLLVTEAAFAEVAVATTTLGISTTSLQAQVTANDGELLQVGISTAALKVTQDALSVSTANLQTVQEAISISTAGLQTEIDALSISTANLKTVQDAISISTAGLQTVQDALIVSTIALANGSGIDPGAITTSKIADGAVTTNKHGDGSVTQSKLASGLNVATADALAVNPSDCTLGVDLADGIDASGNLSCSTVSGGHIDLGAISTAKLASDAVTSVKIADDAVTTNKIADDAVTRAKIAQDGCTVDQILKVNAGGDWRCAADSGGGGDVFLAANQTLTGINTFDQELVLPSHSVTKWAVFHSTGTPTLISGFGISSITDVAVGQPRLNFTTAWSGADSYSCTCIAGTVGNDVGNCGINYFDFVPTATTIDIATFGSGQSPIDMARVHVECIGD